MEPNKGTYTAPHRLLLHYIQLQLSRERSTGQGLPLATKESEETKTGTEEVKDRESNET